MGSTGLATEPKTVEVDSVLVEADIVLMIEDWRVDGQRPIAKLKKELEAGLIKEKRAGQHCWPVLYLIMTILWVGRILCTAL